MVADLAHSFGADFVQGLITPPLVQNTGFGAYIFFAVFCLLSFAWTYIFIPETKGKTLEQMDLVFKDRANAEDNARRVRVNAKVVTDNSVAEI